MSETLPPTLRAAAPDTPESLRILEEYFSLRAAEFPGGSYVPTFPSAAAFDPPAGLFLLATAPASVSMGAEPDEQVIGCGGIRRIPAEAPAIRYEVKHLFLRPAARGRGTGRLLLEALEQQARRWGATELVLDTHHTLEAAGALYQRTGFEQIDRYNDNPNATRWYRKTLGTDDVRA